MYRCPKCGKRDRVIVTSLVDVLLEQDEDGELEGSEPVNDEHEWDENSQAHCGACHHHALVADFDAGELVGPSEEKVRVEYYRCWGGNRGTWDTGFLEIPADTSDDRLDEAVRTVAASLVWTDGPPQFVGFYANCDEEKDDDDDD